MTVLIISCKTVCFSKIHVCASASSCNTYSGPHILKTCRMHVPAASNTSSDLGRTSLVLGYLILLCIRPSEQWLGTRTVCLDCRAGSAVLQGKSQRCVFACLCELKCVTAGCRRASWLPVGTELPLGCQGLRQSFTME